MNETLGLIWVVLGTVAVTLLAVLAGVGVVTLLDARLTMRRMRESLDALGPKAGETLENLREISGTALDATRGMQGAGAVFAQVKREAGKLTPWIPLVLAIFGAISAIRSRRRAEG